MKAELLKAITQALEESLTISLPGLNASPVAGGDICQSYLLQSGTQYRFFVKTHKATFSALFSAEQRSLLEIAKSQSIATATPLATGSGGDNAFLVLEYLDFSNQSNEKQLGKQLAHMHRFTHTQFGFFENNFIGTTPQANQWTTSWSEFWLTRRLQPQLTLAYKKGFRSALEPLEAPALAAAKTLLEKHQPDASLVHGDLWGGNKACLRNSNPVIFDPACYYGDREVDIAMTRLFGGFDASFYAAYEETWPLPAGTQERQNLYNLYHQLNHLNLFGASYLDSCLHSLHRLIR